MSKAQKTTPTFKPEDFEFVDLGLPSGRRWAKINAPGHYTFNQAADIFADYLPKGAAMVELIEECKVEWNDKKHGLDITGPNGNSIFLPAAGYIYPGENSATSADAVGCYWTRMTYVPNSDSYGSDSQAHARLLYFHSGGVYPLNYGLRSRGFSVRPCREFD